MASLITRIVGSALNEDNKVVVAVAGWHSFWLPCHAYDRAPSLPSSWFVTTQRRYTSELVRRGDRDRKLVLNDRVDSREFDRSESEAPSPVA